MKQKTLNPLERQTLEQMYNFHPNKQAQLHAHGLLLLDQGYSFEEVARILLRCQKSVYNWRPPRG